MVFMMETKSGSRKMDSLRRRMGFKGCFTIDCVGRSGGLCLLWEEGVELTVKSYTNHHIDSVIRVDEFANPWRFTVIYGWLRK